MRSPISPPPENSVDAETAFLETSGASILESVGFLVFFWFIPLDFLFLENVFNIAGFQVLARSCGAQKNCPMV
jgi:hypothetical protein